MPKQTFIAFDATGAAHIRSTAREYTHTVVYKGGYERSLANAKDKGWRKTDTSNFQYHSKIAAGSDPYPERYHREAPKWTPEQIAEERAWVDAANAKRLADAIKAVEGHTLESYLAAQEAARIASVEAAKAAGKYDTWRNAGFNGRLDLARKLAADYAGRGYATEILPCRVATKEEIKGR